MTKKAEEPKQLPPGDDGSRLIDNADFIPWPGDPFVGMPRKMGQTDYECNQCGRVERHPYYPDVPRSWWWRHDVATDTVALVCRPLCAAQYSELKLPNGIDIKDLLKAVVAAGWRYRRPEKKDREAVKVPKLSGGWGNGSV